MPEYLTIDKLNELRCELSVYKQTVDDQQKFVDRLVKENSTLKKENMPTEQPTNNSAYIKSLEAAVNQYSIDVKKLRDENNQLYKDNSMHQDRIAELTAYNERKRKKIVLLEEQNQEIKDWVNSHL